MTSYEGLAGDKIACPTDRVYRSGEFHRFEAGGREFLYLVPAGAIFELDDASRTVLDLVREGRLSHNLLMDQVAERGVPVSEVEELIAELYQSRAIISHDTIPDPPQNPPADFPLQTL